MNNVKFGTGKNELHLCFYAVTYNNNKYTMDRITISFNTPIIILFFLSFLMMICRYRIESGITFVMFPVEMVIFLFLLLLSNKYHNYWIDNNIIYIYIAFIIYRICGSILTTFNIHESIRGIIFFEFGLILVVYNCFKITSKEHFFLFIRNAGRVNAVLGTYEFVSRNSLFLRFINVGRSAFAIGSLGTYRARVRTIFVHPIICAAFCTVSWLILLYYPIRNRIICFLIRLLIIISIIGTQSRSSWISFAIINLVYAATRIKNKKDTVIEVKTIQRFFLASLFLAIIGYIFRDTLSYYFDIIRNRWLDGLNSNQAANYQRVNMLLNGLGDFSQYSFLQKLFGRGNGYALSYLKQHPIVGWTDAVDNTYLSVLMNYGLIGLFFMIYFIICSIRNALSEDALNQMCGLCLLSIFISGFFYECLSWYTTDFLIAIMLAGISFKYCNESETELTSLM